MSKFSRADRLRRSVFAAIVSAGAISFLCAAALLFVASRVGDLFGAVGNPSIAGTLESLQSVLAWGAVPLVCASALLGFAFFYSRTLLKTSGVRVFTRSDGYAERDLIHYAHDHLASAQFLFERSPSCYDSGACLGHVGIELLLKALLLHNSDEFPATHDLNKLRRLLARAAPDIEITPEGRSILSRINKLFGLRYPVPSGAQPIETEDLEGILALARALVSALPQEFQEEFDSQLEKGGRVLMRKPIGPKGAAQQGYEDGR